MANITQFTIEVFGAKENVEKFQTVFTNENDFSKPIFYGVSRNNDGTITELEDGKFKGYFSGECKWGIDTAFQGGDDKTKYADIKNLADEYTIKIRAKGDNEDGSTSFVIFDGLGYPLDDDDEWEESSEEDSEEDLFKIENGVLKDYYGNDYNADIPEGVTEIGDHAFEGAGLYDVTIPEGVTKIGDYAFSGCDLLSDIDIPEGVTEIGDYAFSDCTDLSEVTIPSSVKKIGKGAFANCECLEEVTVPEDADVADDAFPEDCEITRE